MHSTKNRDDDHFKPFRPLNSSRDLISLSVSTQWRQWWIEQIYRTSKSNSSKKYIIRLINKTFLKSWRVSQRIALREPLVYDYAKLRELWLVSKCFYLPWGNYEFHEVITNSIAELIYKEMTMGGWGWANPTSKGRSAKNWGLMRKSPAKELQQLRLRY